MPLICTRVIQDFANNSLSKVEVYNVGEGIGARTNEGDQGIAG